MLPETAEQGPLRGLAVGVRDDSVATLHAKALLGALGATHSTDGGASLVVGDGTFRTASQDWAASGAMALTGRRDGPALHPVGGPASALRGALAALRGLGRDAEAVDRLTQVDERLLGERAAIAGLTRQGPWSAGGAFRLLPAADGWVGINLPRNTDLELVPALTHGAVRSLRTEDWGPSTAGATRLVEWVATRPTAELLGQARMLGLPLVRVPAADEVPDAQLRARWGRADPSWVRLTPGGPRPSPDGDVPLVVNLASLWAGPLAAHVLGLAGARVVTVESRGRPDGSRRGPRVFHDLLHAGQEMVALDLPAPGAVDMLRHLVARADLVVDGSRPRAMRQLGIDVDEVVAQGTCWISITGYGRTGPWADMPAFGDDAAAAAGLVAWDEHGAVPAGDAIADPLAGAHAAVAATAVLRDRRAWLVDIAMREVSLLASRLDTGPPTTTTTVPEPPHARRPAAAARPLGADMPQIVTDLGIAP